MLNVLLSTILLKPNSKFKIQEYAPNYERAPHFQMREFFAEKDPSTKGRSVVPTRYGLAQAAPTVPRKERIPVHHVQELDTQDFKFQAGMDTLKIDVNTAEIINRETPHVGNQRLQRTLLNYIR